MEVTKPGRQLIIANIMQAHFYPHKGDIRKLAISSYPVVLVRLVQRLATMKRRLPSTAITIVTT